VSPFAVSEQLRATRESWLTPSPRRQSAFRPWFDSCERRWWVDQRPTVDRTRWPKAVTRLWHDDILKSKSDPTERGRGPILY